jgi:hypothetical protein
MAISSVRQAEGGITAWPYWRAVRDALTLAGLLYIALVWARVVPYAPPVHDYGPMLDARGYWSAWQGGLYDIAWPIDSAYVYSPAFAQLIWPLTLLPWGVFAALFTIASVGCLFWMRVPWMIAFPGVIDDILRGQIHVLLAGMIVLGFRHPGVWAFGLLTKVTPGVGLLWFAARAEWRQLLVALATGGGIAAISFVVTPALWFDWLDLLRDSSGVTAGIQLVPLPLSVRIVVGAGIVVLAARTNRSWLVPIGVLVALPNVWTTSTALIAGSVALWRTRGPASQMTPPQPTP